HFLTHIPQPIQRNSEMKAILSVGLTSIQSLPAPRQYDHRNLSGDQRTHLDDWT
ncbi:uncharacterized protein C8Q71DRAFT_708888, partial [Rhodofomes roseus]